MFEEYNQHTEEKPHWSESIAWRPGRFESLSNAPTKGNAILPIRGREANGRIVEPMHYANGSNNGLVPGFRGWFVPSPEGKGYIQCRPVEWQPLRAQIEEETLV